MRFFRVQQHNSFRALKKKSLGSRDGYDGLLLIDYTLSLSVVYFIVYRALREDNVKGSIDLYELNIEFLKRNLT